MEVKHPTPFAIARLGHNGRGEYLRIPSPTPYTDVIALTPPDTIGDLEQMVSEDVVHSYRLVCEALVDALNEWVAGRREDFVPRLVFPMPELP